MAFDFTHVTAPFRMQPGLCRFAPGQTFIPIPGQRQAVFTIRVELVPLGDLIVTALRHKRCTTTRSRA